MWITNNTKSVLTDHQEVKWQQVTVPWKLLLRICIRNLQLATVGPFKFSGTSLINKELAWMGIFCDNNHEEWYIFHWGSLSGWSAAGLGVLNQHLCYSMMCTCEIHYRILKVWWTFLLKLSRGIAFLHKYRSMTLPRAMLILFQETALFPGDLVARLLSILMCVFHWGQAGEWLSLAIAAGWW